MNFLLKCSLIFNFLFLHFDCIFGVRFNPSRCDTEPGEHAGYNLVTGKEIVSNSTCGDVPEIYCTLTSTSIKQDGDCSVCDNRLANQSHPITYAIDCDSKSYWKSKNNQPFVQIDIDLSHEYHVAYVIFKMGPSFHPRSWILQKSTDFGKTYVPWQYFATSFRECMNKYEIPASQMPTKDNQVLCSTEFSKLDLLEYKEIYVELITNRPGAKTIPGDLQEWSKATNVRLVFQEFYTLHANIVDDDSVAKRLYYSIMDISIGGLCFCNQYSDKCSFTEEKDLVCNCLNNTSGVFCETCSPLYNQYPWKPNLSGNQYCQKCNCHGHADKCQYNADVERNKQSLNINNERKGGGICICKNNTAGVNCEYCLPGYSRPLGAAFTAPCTPCECNIVGSKSNIPVCYEDGSCLCKANFSGLKCDECETNHWGFPDCQACNCDESGSMLHICNEYGQCFCRPDVIGRQCNECAEDYWFFPDCQPCNCDLSGSLSSRCSEDGNCHCKLNVVGSKCDECAPDHRTFPECLACNCNPAGSLSSQCFEDGLCQCKLNIAGEKCEHCISNYWGFPDCEPCECDKDGSWSKECDKEGNCNCKWNIVGQQCDKCSPGYGGFPDCESCDCNILGSLLDSCTKDGICQCKPDVVGSKCDKCRSQHWDFPNCKPCDCTDYSSIFKQCDVLAGKCEDTGRHRDHNCEDCEECDECSLLLTYSTQELLTNASAKSYDLKDLTLDDLMGIHIAHYQGRHTDYKKQVESMYTYTSGWFGAKTKKHRLENKVEKIKEDADYLEKFKPILEPKLAKTLKATSMIQMLFSQTLPITQQLHHNVTETFNIIQGAVNDLETFKKTLSPNFDVREHEETVLYWRKIISQRQMALMEKLMKTLENKMKAKDLLNSSKSLFKSHKNVADLRNRLSSSNLTHPNIHQRLTDLSNRAMIATYSPALVNNVANYSKQFQKITEEINHRAENINRIVMRSEDARKNYDNAFKIFKELEEKLSTIKTIQNKLVNWVNSSDTSFNVAKKKQVTRYVKDLSQYIKTLQKSLSISPVLAFIIKQQSDVAFASLNHVVGTLVTSLQNMIQFLSTVDQIELTTDSPKKPWIKPFSNVSSGSVDNEEEYGSAMNGDVEIEDEPEPEISLDSFQQDDNAFIFSGDHIDIAVKLDIVDLKINDSLRKGLMYIKNEANHTQMASKRRKQESDHLMDAIGVEWKKIDASKLNLRDANLHLEEHKHLFTKVKKAIMANKNHNLELDSRLFEKHLDYNLGRSYNATRRVRRSVQNCKQLEREVPFLIECQRVANTTIHQVKNQNNVINHKMKWLTLKREEIQALHSRMSESISNLKLKIQKTERLASKIQAALQFSSPGFIKYIKHSPQAGSPLTEIEMTIRTMDTRALVFYMENSNINLQQFYLRLDKGHPILTWITSGLNVSLEHSDSLISNHWNDITCKRIGDLISIELNGVIQESGSIGLTPLSGIFHYPNNLYIGGLPELIKESTGFVPDLDGCIGSLKFHGHNLGLFAFQQVRGVQKICPYTKNITSDVTFNGNGFLEFNFQNTSTYFNPLIIEFSFSTIQKDALLLYGMDSNQEDFLLIQLVNGMIVVTYNTLNKTTHLQSRKENYHDGQYHSLKFERKENIGTLVLNEKDRRSALSLEWRMGNLINTLYLGGLPLKQREKFDKSSSLLGCFINFAINGRLVSFNLYKAAEGINLLSCNQQKLFSCVHFDVDSLPVIIHNLPFGIKPLSFEFKTTTQEGVVFQFTTQVANLGLLVHHGAIIAWVRYSSGLESDKIVNMANITRLWHSVLIQESRDSLVLIVDDSTVQLAKPVNSKINSLSLGSTNADIGFLHFSGTQKIFNGRIRNLMISSRLYDLKKFVIPNNLRHCT